MPFFSRPQRKQIQAEQKHNFIFHSAFSKKKKNKKQKNKKQHLKLPFKSNYMNKIENGWLRQNNYQSVQSLSRVQLFATPWTAACQTFLSITNSGSLLKLMSIESVIPTNHLILCQPLLLLPSIFPSIRSFPISQFFASGGQSIRVSASASVLPMNIQDWFPLGWTDWIFLQSKGLLRVFSNTTVQKHQFFGAQFSSQSNSLIHTWPLEKP